MPAPKPQPDSDGDFRSIQVKSTLTDAKRPEIQILKEVRGLGYCEESVFAIKLALEEAMTNAVKHGNDNDASKHITVSFRVNAEQVVIIVRDEGAGFQPDSVPDPTTADRLTLPNGRGIMLMRAYMDEVEYRADGREVYLMKRKRK